MYKGVLRTIFKANQKKLCNQPQQTQIIETSTWILFSGKEKGTKGRAKNVNKVKKLLNKIKKKKIPKLTVKKT